ncbi:hypothetical protein L4D09_28630, partial [Photobacterium makurazakiensis]
MNLLKSIIITVYLLLSFHVNSSEWVNIYQIPTPTNIPDRVNDVKTINDGGAYIISGIALDLSTILNDYSLTSGENKPHSIVIVSDTLTINESIIT